MQGTTIMVCVSKYMGLWGSCSVKWDQLDAVAERCMSSAVDTLNLLVEGGGGEGWSSPTAYTPNHNLM